VSTGRGRGTLHIMLISRRFRNLAVCASMSSFFLRATFRRSFIAYLHKAASQVSYVIFELSRIGVRSARSRAWAGRGDSALGLAALREKTRSNSRSVLLGRYLAADRNARAKSGQLLQPAERARDFSTVTFMIQATSESESTYPTAERRLRIVNAALFISRDYARR
jgi:hypothetical protein